MQRTLQEADFDWFAMVLVWYLPTPVVDSHHALPLLDLPDVGGLDNNSWDAHSSPSQSSFCFFGISLLECLDFFNCNFIYFIFLSNGVRQDAGKHCMRNVCNASCLKKPWNTTAVPVGTKSQVFQKIQVEGSPRSEVFFCVCNIIGIGESTQPAWRISY